MTGVSLELHEEARDGLEDEVAAHRGDAVRHQTDKKGIGQGRADKRKEDRARGQDRKYEEEDSPAKRQRSEGKRRGKAKGARR